MAPESRPADVFRKVFREKDSKLDNSENELASAISRARQSLEERRANPKTYEVPEEIVVEKVVEVFDEGDSEMDKSVIGMEVVRIEKVLGKEHSYLNDAGDRTYTAIIDSNGVKTLAGIWEGINPSSVVEGDSAVYNKNDKLICRIINSESPSKIPKVTFEDISGLTEQKKDLVSLLDVFNPELRNKGKGLARKFINAALLYGPSGTGKTSLARAAAHYAGIPFFEINTPELFGSHLGESVQNLRSRIVVAQKFARKSGGAIVYFDEITRLAAMRNYSNSGADREVSAVTEELQSLMNGEHYVDESEGLILYLASSNLAEVFDPAILSRFKKHILVPAPTKNEKKEIFRVKVKNVKTQDLDFDYLTGRLEEMNVCASGRDIDTITEIAKESAHLGGRDFLLTKDYDRAFTKYSQRVEIALSKGNQE